MEPVTSLAPQQQWARATLVAGKAAVQRWTIDGSKHKVKLVVGRDPESDWAIDAEGVLPRHLALQWNGERLWLEPLDDGVALVNGMLLVEPLCVLRTAWVEFGGAVMIVDASAAPSAAASPTPPDATARHLRAAEEREVSLSSLSSEPSTSRCGAELAEAMPKEANDPPLPSSRRAALNTTVIAPLSRLCPELAGDVAPIAVPEPRLGTPPAMQERERTGSSAPLPVRTTSIMGGLALSAYLAHAVAFLARHGLRLALALGATLGVSVVPLSQQQVPRPLQTRPLAIAAAKRPSASLAIRQGADQDAHFGAAPPAQATPTNARSALPPQPPTPEGASDLRAAAESLVAGRYEQALPAYARLAETTGKPVFETIREVLERRLRARCEEREAQGGEPCGL